MSGHFSTTGGPRRLLQTSKPLSRKPRCAPSGSHEIQQPSDQDDNSLNLGAGDDLDAVMSDAIDDDVESSTLSDAPPSEYSDDGELQSFYLQSARNSGRLKNCYRQRRRR